MAELADALASGASRGSSVQVQVLLSAPDKNKTEPFGSVLFLLFYALSTTPQVLRTSIILPTISITSSLVSVRSSCEKVSLIVIDLP